MDAILRSAMSLPAASELTQFGLKLLYSGTLLAGIVMLGTEIWRVWLDRALVLAPFSYLRDGTEAREAGQGFTLLFSHDLLRFRDVYAADDEGGGGIPSTDQVGRGASIRLPESRPDVWSEVEVEAYGIQVTKLLRRLSRWVRRPHEIAGNISERSKKLDLYAEVRGGRFSGRGAPPHWNLAQYESRDELSRALACRVLRFLAAQQTPRLFGADRAERRVTDEEFCGFLRGLEAYQLYQQRLSSVGTEADASASLTQAAKTVEALLARRPRFPFTHKLAAYVLREQEKLDRALREVDRYSEALDAAMHTDQQAQALRDEIAVQLAEAQARTTAPSDREGRARVRPVRPGLSVSGVGGTAGTICCRVRDASGRHYVLTADHSVPGGVGEAVVQPGTVDGGTLADQIGTVAQVVKLDAGAENFAAGALVALADGVEFSNDVPERGPIAGVVEDPTALLGAEVTLVGRSGVHTGTVLGVDKGVMIHLEEGTLAFSGLIVTTPMSQPGDSGAPVLTADGRLVGYVFAASPRATLLMPAVSVLEALGVTLD